LYPFFVPAKTYLFAAFMVFLIILWMVFVLLPEHLGMPDSSDFSGLAAFSVVFFAGLGLVMGIALVVLVDGRFGDTTISPKIAGSACPNLLDTSRPPAVLTLQIGGAETKGTGANMPPCTTPSPLMRDTVIEGDDQASSGIELNGVVSTSTTNKDVLGNIPSEPIPPSRNTLCDWKYVEYPPKLPSSEGIFLPTENLHLKSLSLA
jgi:hypothetical protein